MEFVALIALAIGGLVVAGMVVTMLVVLKALVWLVLLPFRLIGWMLLLPLLLFKAVLGGLVGVAIVPLVRGRGSPRAGRRRRPSLASVAAARRRRMGSLRRALPPRRGRVATGFSRDGVCAPESRRGRSFAPPWRRTLQRSAESEEHRLVEWPADQLEPRREPVRRQASRQADRG